jgi:hypothetical protein
MALLACAALPAHASFFISANPTTNVSCTAGYCTPTAQMATLNATDLANMLATSDVTVATGNTVKDIFVKASFGWTSTHRLTLDAHRSITVERPVVVSGPGGLTLNTNEGSKSGVLSFGPKGRVAFWDTSSSLVVNGIAFTLVSDVGGLASAIAGNSAGNFALAGDVHSTTAYTASPIPTTYTGTLEGLGNRIFYLQINDTGTGQHDGLFAAIGTGGVVRDLSLVKAKIFGGIDSWAGTLAALSYGTIERVSATGLVKSMFHPGFGYIGGLVAWNYGDITSAHTDVALTGGYNMAVGGVVGTFGSWNDPGGHTISDSTASGAVRGGQLSYVGGLVGLSIFENIRRSHATGLATAGYQSLVGGLAGENNGTSIDSSYATGAVQVGNRGNAGGLIGLSGSTGGGDTSTVSNSYATGSVTGQTAQLGSLFGECCFNTNTFVQNSYGTGAVSGAPKAMIGGTVGWDGQQGVFTATYWDTDTTGIGNLSQGAGNAANDPGISGLSDAQLKSALPGGFDPAVWGQDPNINNGWPYLLANPPQ